ncbi:thioesterase II family protein [Micromonospora mangrovi]|uniref:Thioesterase domain-containing protein n=2 Tax=Micromonospora TaxID=1873 RepID=A0AAU7MEZ8_9ACTN
MPELTRPYLPIRAGAALPRLRLFCFPHAGGAASAYRRWLRDVPDGVEILPVQLPGRENRLAETPHTDLATLVDELADALAAHLCVPYALVGNSLGALVATELARELARRDAPAPAHLVVAAAPPDVRRDLAPVAGLPDAALIAAIHDRHGGIPVDLAADPAFAQFIVTPLRADMTLVESCRPAAAPVLGCPLTAFVGDRDTTVDLADLQGWRAVSTGAFVAHELTGDHFALLHHRDRVLAAVSTTRG